MNITLSKLREMMGEAWECGSIGCRELRDDDIQAILKKHRISDIEEYRRYTCAELKTMPVGTIFQHMNRGRCHIEQNAHDVKFMVFDWGLKNVSLNNDDEEPWDQNMKLMYKPSI